MYKPFFKLHSNPFNSNPDPRFLFTLPQTREALAGLEHGIAAHKGFIVLTGEVGTGKTTLLRCVLASFDPARVFTAFIFNPRLEVLELLEFILTDFGIPIETRTKSSMLIALNRWLVERFRKGETCVIFIDEAQDLSADLLEEIRLLTNLETSSEKLLQIVLSGQPEFENKLRNPDLRQLRQRISLWCRTYPLSAEQTGAYIVERLRIGGTTGRIFLPDAVQLIYRASRGIPRIINLICEHSLITAYVDQQHRISASIVQGVLVDLDLDVQPFSMSSGLEGVSAKRETGRQNG